MEATIVCIDNSEWTRSGDYAPTRFQAQADAVNLLAGAKTQAHPENTVGVLTMAGKTPRVLVTPTPDLGKVLNCMTDIEVDGEANFPASVQIAQLALKHRQNKNQRQRIVIFAGSPIAEDKETLVKIAKKLKKNSVAVDIVSFGCEEENEEKLEAFFQAVNSNGNSHLVTVPPGPVLSDVLISSPIFQGEGGSGYGFGAAGAGGGAAGFEFGVDPNIDPDLALALRVSLEEERARQNAAAAAAGTTGTGGEAAADKPAEGASAAAVPAGAGPAMDMELDEDALLQQALAMSMQVDQPATSTPAPAAAATATPAAPAPPAAPADDGMFDVDDEELRMALALSMQDAGPEPQAKPEDSSKDDMK
mmetsp:Transcript_21323/g.46591  ORF Transcript_21323/g.46591 Transcript_21323/m.46591 type:complete len:362 (-) Transcript_21323:453-1538(-)|eukprot:CAMPEP_0202890162 /NCGR_PEP_ID=MMETSP1392-20130828/665_1 /ASSEMBLY_ACC=CAM_ASM_000868 /TAXON_ID=225041 /ORGANISM="Chlamydomonas chlamydogama, Strain SAG 11-48b" /LENGTH=361 /DNA_ID=CAMNT_0049573683 /DNA_START=141 /DNA_END=1226 /DNA_ORIENTATION=+